MTLLHHDTGVWMLQTNASFILKSDATDTRYEYSATKCSSSIQAGTLHISHKLTKQLWNFFSFIFFLFLKKAFNEPLKKYQQGATLFSTKQWIFTLTT